MSLIPTHYSSMSTRDVSDQPSFLFDAPPPPALQQPPKQEKGNEGLARDFVRWCCSFGPNFRNSPDVANLRYWAKKSKVKIKAHEERTILETARISFLKHIEKLTRKNEPAAELGN